MSAIHLTAAIQLATDLVQLLLLAADDDGLIDLGTSKAKEVGSLFRVLSYVVATGLLLLTALKSRGAMAAIITAGISAAVFVYFVHNITDVEDRVDNEVNGSAPAFVEHAATPPAPSVPVALFSNADG